MKKILILLLLATSLCYGQNNEPDGSVNTSNYITFNPLTILNYDIPRYRFGYTHTLAPKWKASLDLGYGSEGTSIIFDPIRDSEDYQLIELRLETYYLFKVRPKASDYVSLELFYINHTETFLTDYYFIGDREIKIDFDSVAYERNKWGANLKVGSFLTIWEKIGLNIYAGFGFRVRDNDFTNVLNPEVGPFEDEDNDAYFLSTQNITRQEGSRTGFNVTAGIKIYYKIK